MDGTAVRCVIHVGPADAEVGGCAEVTGVGEPCVGIGVDEEPGMAPRGRCGKVVEIGGGSLGEEVNGPVEKDGHASKPDGQKEDGPVAKEAEEKVHGELGDFGVISQ